MDEQTVPRYKDIKEPNAFVLDDDLKDDFSEEEIYRDQQAAMSPEQRQRQQQAMDERVELDKQKKEVSEWRIKHNQKQLKREEQHLKIQLLKKTKMAKPALRKQSVNSIIEPLLYQLPRETVHIVPVKKRWHKQELDEQDAKEDVEEEQYHNEDEDDVSEDMNSQSSESDGNKTLRPTDDNASVVDEKLHDLFVQRLNFQAQCGRSNLYNNCQLFSE